MDGSDVFNLNDEQPLVQDIYVEQKLIEKPDVEHDDSMLEHELTDSSEDESSDDKSSDSSSSASLAKEKKRKRKAKPGHRALREIRIQQQSVEHNLKRKPFARIVRQISLEVSSESFANKNAIDGENKNGRFLPIKWEAEAIESLRAAAEAHLVQVFQRAQTMAVRLKHQTVQDEDFIYAVEDAYDLKTAKEVQNSAKFIHKNHLIYLNDKKESKRLKTIRAGEREKEEEKRRKG